MTTVDERERRIADLKALLRRLAAEHKEAADRVDEYSRRRYLSPGEQLEMKTLQRFKLIKKDRMVAVERELVGLEQS